MIFIFLRLFHEYGASVSALPYQYQWHDKRLQQVRELIPATVFENTSNQFELQKKLMFWVNRSLLSGEAPPSVRPMNGGNFKKVEGLEKPGLPAGHMRSLNEGISLIWFSFEGDPMPSNGFTSDGLSLHDHSVFRFVQQMGRF